MRLKCPCFTLEVGRDSVVGIATCYGLGGSGIECRWGRDFPHTFRPVLGPSQPPVQCVPCLFPGGKVATTPPSAEVIERVELFLFFPSWPLAGRIYLTFYSCTELINCTAWFWGASSPFCWFNNKKKNCILHIELNTTIFHLVVQ